MLGEKTPMTYYVDFYAEQAFLAFVKKSISMKPTDDDEMVQIGAVSVLACAAALEAMVNFLYKEDGRLPHFDELRLTSKIDTIAHLTHNSIDWGTQPWQDVARLITMRNWLAHYKDPNIGLLGSARGGWVDDGINKPPKIDPFQELSSPSIKHFYKATRLGLKELCSFFSIDPMFIEFLDTEDYEPFAIG